MIASLKGFAFLTLSVIASISAQSRYVGDPVQFTPEQEKWFLDLRNEVTGGRCCDHNDGDFTSQDLRLGADGKTHYWATVEGEWNEVPDSAVLTGPNLVGRPLVWFQKYRSLRAGGLTTTILCFQPGALG